MFDLLLSGGTIVDGLGGTPYKSDVGLKEGHIVALGDLTGVEATRTLDCRGLCISPGWVDIHGHADWTVLDYPIGLNLLIQGCTLTVAGNCGMNPAPVQGHASAIARQDHERGGGNSTQRLMYERHPSTVWSMGEYLDEVERARPGVHYVQLVGHGAIRRCVVGHEPRKANDSDIAAMQALVESAMQEGAFGMSSGLVFIPGCWSDTPELIELCKVVAKHGGLYTSHIRGERETNIEAAQEFIAIAERSGVRANMSHMQSKYPVYGNAVVKIDLLEQARSRGVDVTCDSEVFLDTRANPAQFLQIYSYTAEELSRKLSTHEGRAEIKNRMRTIHPWHPLGRFGPGGVPFRRAWERVVIYDCPHDRSLEGKTVAQVAAARGIEMEDALFDLEVAEDGKGPIFIHDYIEDEHWRTYPWPYCIFPSVDTGLYDPAKLSPDELRFWRDTRYPGTIGLFPRVLGQFVREEKIVSLQEAVRKMTSLPMQRLGISDRGVVRPGMWADLTVFNQDTIALRGKNPDPANVETFYPVGVHYVLVNGQVAVEGHAYTGLRAGQVLRKKS